MSYRSYNVFFLQITYRDLQDLKQPTLQLFLFSVFLQQIGNKKETNSVSFVPIQLNCAIILPNKNKDKIKAEVQYGQTGGVK